MASKLSDSARILICLDIGCELLNIPIDQTSAIRCSGQSKSHYLNQRKILIKVLNLTKTLSIDDVILRLSINNTAVENIAKRMFDAYQKDSRCELLDMEHPQYITMCVFQACKIGKVKVQKKNIMAISNLKPAQWSNLEKQWDKWLEASSFVNSIGENAKHKEFGLRIKESDQPAIAKTSSKSDGPETEDYDVWAKRITKEANDELHGKITMED